MIVGAALIPLLPVRLQPTVSTQTLTVSCGWGGASPTMMENEVVSKLEGMLGRIDGITDMNSTSGLGSGNVTLTFKEGTKMDAVRFEAASIIRFLYPKLPEGVSYPGMSLSTGGDQQTNQRVLSYSINTGLSSQDTKRYIEENIVPVLSRISGVGSVSYGGIRPYEYEIIVDPDAALAAGVTMGQIAQAFNGFFSEATIGNVTYGKDDENVILLKARMSRPTTDFEQIPVMSVDGRIVRIGDLATVTYKQVLPTSYNRINGLNVVTVTVMGDKGSNAVALSSQVKATMAELEKSFPTGFAAEVNYDAADHINKELRKIFMRTLMTFVILMLFVLVVSRNWRYVMIIFITLIANILIAIIFYYLMGLQIHIYSLAGITVSLGMIIDSSIIMIDHYSYYRNLKAYLAILAAVTTSIGSLMVVFLLPAHQQLMFGDFAWMIIINLAVSLLISLFFIPALLDRIPLRRAMTATGIRTKRVMVRLSCIYIRFIGWGKRHKWIFIMLLVLGFGIPIHKLPAKLSPKRGEEATRWMNVYNKTVGTKFYQENKAIPEKVLGGSFRLFDRRRPPGRAMNNEPERVKLTIRGSMVEGNTVHQLNEIIRGIENYLSQFDEIESFRTNVMSYDNSLIEVTFKPEHEKGSFPYMLDANLRREVMRSGGATWGIHGLPNLSFNNNVRGSSDYMSHRIILSGYNYETLLRYAEELRDTLAENRRVTNVGIFAGEVRWGADRRRQEFFIDIDRERALMTGANLSGYFGRVSQLLYSSSLRRLFIDGRTEQVSLASSQRNSFDLWHVENFPLQVDTVRVKLADFGTIDKQFTGLNIYKQNQSYQLTVAFDFVGSWEMSNRLIRSQVERLNDEVLPIGYLAREQDHSGWWGQQHKGVNALVLILLVIAIIYCISTIIFESLIKPLIVILMIPVSFIGVFLTFGLFGFPFDQGGFASFILLCGLVVNAGIYVVNEYNILGVRYPSRTPLRLYITAYNRKIVPITLTIISTFLGLIPFVVNGRGDVFWYSFAVGTMGGMFFSIIAFLVYLPIFMPLKKRK